MISLSRLNYTASDKNYIKLTNIVLFEALPLTEDLI